MLRRQAMRPWRKPLVVFTPKSMLRNPLASSPIADLTPARPRFLPVVPENEVGNGTRVLVCSGKIGHELREERTRRKDNSTAIIFLDQLYPFPEEELAAELARHTGEIVWVQEEPGNMGALSNIVPKIAAACGNRSFRAGGEAFAERESGDGIGESPRTGAEDAAYAGVYDRESVKEAASFGYARFIHFNLCPLTIHSSSTANSCAKLRAF